MIRTLLVGAVALDEMVFSERHGSTDSGVYDEGEVVYGENGVALVNNVIVKPVIVPSAVEGDSIYVGDGEEGELVYGKNGEITEITDNVVDECDGEEEEIEDESDGEEEIEDEEEIVDSEEENEPEADEELSESEEEIENEIEITENEAEIEEVTSDENEDEGKDNEEPMTLEDALHIGKVDSKDALRAELQELLAEEEEENTMVKLVEEEQALAEKKLENGKETENGVHQENEHHIPNPTDGLLGLDVNGDVIITDEIIGDVEMPSQQNGHSDETKNEKIEDENGTISQEEQDIAETPQNCDDVTMQTEALAPQESQESEELPRLRRSTRERKPRNAAKDTTGDVFKDMNLKTFALEGHHEDICSVDMYQTFVVSGGRDTSLKLWDGSSKEELLSLGGHEGTISCVCFMADQTFENRPPVITASSDCSLRVWNMDEGKMVKSIYVYSPVSCLDYSKGLVAIGTEGGKVEVYGVDDSSQQFTVNAYHDPVTSIKFLDTDRVACGSTNGIVKIYNIASPDEKEPIFSLNPENIKVYNKHEAGSKPYESQSSSILNMSKVTCMEVWDNLVLYGDSGYNIKVLDYQKGELVKVRNNLKEFCPTETLHIASVQSKPFLFSVGSDVDNGDAYINIRSLPDLQYLGTIRDIELNSGSVISMALQEINNQINFATGGAQIRVWNQVGRRGRKRKVSPNGDLAIVPCKYICNFTDPRDSEPESDDQSETESELKTETSTEISTERIPAGSANSWCSIL